MKNMITAADAFEISAQQTEKAEKILNDISSKIVSAARSGQYSIDFNFNWFCPSEVRDEVIKGLSNCGYSLGFTYGPDLRIFWKQEQPSPFITSLEP